MSYIPFVLRDRFAHTFNLLTGKPTKTPHGAWRGMKACRLALGLPLLFAFLPGSAHAQVNFGLEPVGIASAAQNVNVTASAAGNVAAVQVLTLGAPNLDFTPGSGASPCATASLSIGSSCVQSVTFTPTAPGLRLGAVVLLDGNSNILAITYISGTGQGGLGVLVPGNVIPVAGTLATWEQVLDGQPALQADLDQPAGVVLDGAGNI
jgi:hypothetical protein